ncbi:fimbrial protein [Serratia proteamaculans]|uniref:Fimbrial protein n=1 Tax=Serratia proteamaculans TaxID=28151 RepID=A0A5Q2VB79_SERPR|nr:fimbrial protein [Serratia proteamaculans]QGH60613.1 fimbrial protein [Serratia proteamaculans]
MKKTLLVSSLLTSSLLSVSALAATTVPGGTINFVGTVVDTACAVQAGQGGTNSTVDMGQITLRSFKDPADKTKFVANQLAGAPQQFNIVLADCDTSTQKNAAITFKGVAASGNSKVLAAGSGAGSAQGIGLQIFDSAGTAIDLGSASPAMVLNDGENNMAFSADYISTSVTPKAGQANATATFTVTYS